MCPCYPVAFLLEVELMLAGTGEVFDSDIPVTADIDLGSRQLSRLRATSFSEDLVNPFGDDLLIAWLHLAGCDADAGLALGIAAAHGNAWFVSGKILRHLLAANVQPGRVPANHKRRGAIGKARRLLDARLHALDFRHPLGNVVQPGQPGLPFPGMIPGHPSFYRRQHTHNFLAANFIIPVRPVVRRTGLPSRHEDFFIPQHQPGALRSANRFATAIGHDIGPPLQVNAGNG